MGETTIERITPDGWERVRAVRLRALADTPDAFGTLLAEDEARPAASWRSRLEDSTHVTFLARVDDRDVGMIVGAPYRDRDRVAGLFGMWVAPEIRGRGVGGALVDRMVAWARSQGYARVLLGVGDGNEPAIRLYASRGFVPTGVTSTLPAPREHVLEHERALVL